MEKVSVYPYIHSFKADNNSIVNRTAIQSVSTNSALANNAATDVLSLRSKKEIYMDRLNQLFPNGGIDKLYNDINKDFNIDYPADLKFYAGDDGVMAGGFTFSKNEISFSLSDLLDFDTKIVGVKNGKKITLTSPSCMLPLFIDKKSAEEFIQIHSKNGNLGFDELIVEPLTDDDRRQYITQKVAHEVIHAQQHMIMRQTKGIGTKEILKAWTHQKPKNMIEKTLLDIQTMNAYNNSYWANIEENQPIIDKESSSGVLANVWLEAIRNYPRVDSPEYVKNPIEVDAYIRSAKYARNIYEKY